MTTSSEKLIEQRELTRVKAIVRARIGDLARRQIFLNAYTDGWNDGYKAGFQQACDSIGQAFPDMLKAQRGGLLSGGPVELTR
jgi:hypothetical protein